MKRMHRIDELRRRVVDGSGDLDAAVRRAAFDDDPAALPEDARQYVDKVHRHAYEIIDGDIDALRGSFTEDQIFELTVAAATGAGLRRLDTVRQALEDA
jgi:alkylhydroperoxidase family enzyme